MDYEDIEMSLSRRVDSNGKVEKKLRTFSERVVFLINNKIAIDHHNGEFKVTYAEDTKQNGEYVGELEFTYSLLFSLGQKKQTLEVVVRLVANGDSEPAVSIDGDGVEELQRSSFIETVRDKIIELIHQKATQY